MSKVYVLQHTRVDDEYGDDAKFIGVYRSEEAARAASTRLRQKPGFCDYPTGFTVDAYELDMDHWTEGFGSAFQD